MSQAFSKLKSGYDAKRVNELKKIKRQMQGLKNEMDFIEILTQFWPLPNMEQKMERMSSRMESLNSRYYSNLEAMVS